MKDEKTKKWDKKFMEIALSMAEMSHCVGKQVCCLIVKDGRIIVSGLNGTFPGEPNCDDIFNRETWQGTEEEWQEFRATHHEWSKQNEIHAEQNAIGIAAKEGLSLNGATAYVTLSPCRSCAHLLSTSGIRRVVVNQIWDHEPDGIDILKKRGIKVSILS